MAQMVCRPPPFTLGLPFLKVYRANKSWRRGMLSLWDEALNDCDE